ncbi:MAG: serine/threonine-protein kinase [Thermodesulfobacteriota bacterium]
MGMKYGRYEIIKELGRGAMGLVYQAHDPEIDRLLALKVLREDRLTSAAFVQRFLKEARAIGRLSHPRIVTVYDVGQDHGTIYIAMELLQGEPLNALLEKRKFSPEEITNLGIQVAETLDYAHQKGIVHRDIKPSNILVQPDGQIKITDFGIAHIEDPEASVQTQAGEILGTPAYMSPEQVMGQQADGRSDLFSLGIILYELSTGKRPFGGSNLASIFKSITQDQPPSPAELNPAIPKSLSQVIMRCLEKNPASRYPTGKDLADALRETQEVQKRPELAEEFKRPRSFLWYGIIAIILLGGGLSYYLFKPAVVKEPVPVKEVEKETAAKKEAAVEKIKTGFLRLDSNPMEAQIFIDGVFKGKTPARLEIQAGTHEVRLVLPNHYDWEAQVKLKEEEETPLMVNLIPLTEKKMR